MELSYQRFYEITEMYAEKTICNKLEEYELITLANILDLRENTAIAQKVFGIDEQIKKSGQEGIKSALDQKLERLISKQDKINAERGTLLLERT